ncbi:phasin family protein [Paludibacterium yongneupense]|uniref:phasin family protein n=1 Tax=Paludibacterium yongneupense TaxID=400061 RepID=UPI000425DD14|nr:phasin family protein [Paludibacterium yongneupense]
MVAANEQFSKLSANGFESALRFAQIALDSTERVVKLHLELSKQSLEDNVKAARELAGASDPQEAFSRLNKLTTQSLEKVVSNSRNLYDIVSQTQSQLTKLTEENLGSLNKTFLSNIETLGQNAPAGTDAAVNAFKSGIAAAAAAVNSLTRAAQQVAEFTDTSVKAATSATADAVKTASKRSAS